jgi:hypothetical protein
MAAAAPVAPPNQGPPNRAVTTQQRPGPAELFRTLNSHQFIREAGERGMGLSAYLEQCDPSTQYRDGFDAFQRQLQVAGISVMSDADTGYCSDTWEAFDRDVNTRALGYEWAMRVCKRASGRNPNTRALYASTDQPVGSVIEPFANAAQARYPQIAPAIMLADLVAMTTPIQGDAYRAFYLVNDAPSQRFNRVDQGAEIPRAKLLGADRTVRLHKYGKGLDMTYEVLRRARIDLIGLHLARMQVQTEIDKVAAAIDVFVNGDGNANTAATVSNLTTLDSTATVNNLTAKAWLSFKALFVNPYRMDWVLAQSTPVVQLETLNLGSANIPMVAINAASGLGGLNLRQPQLGEGVNVGLTADAPASKIVGFDSRFAIEHVTEIGSEIQEMERFMERQASTIFMSYEDGYIVFDQLACRVLNLSA